MTEQATVAAAEMPLALSAPKQIITPWKADEAIEVFMSLNMPDAEIVSHETIAAIIGVPLDSPFLTYSEVQKHQLKRVDRFEKFRLTLLKTHSVYLRSVHGQGYYIVPPGEQALVANEDLMLTISKEMRRAAAIVKYTRTGAMSNHERTRHNDSEVKQLGLAQMIKSVRRNFLRGREEETEE